MNMFKQRTFLVTGASRGIGLAIAELLYSKGHLVIGVAHLKPIKKFSGVFYLVDLSDAKATEKLFLQINTNHQIDGVINNAGITLPQALPEITLSNFEVILNLNLRPALQATQIFMPAMIENRWGRIVNISSRSILGKKNYSVYAASKSGLVAFTRCWALELAEFGITVNAICPGPTETDLFRLNTPKGSEAEQRLIKNIPLGRIANPWDISPAIAFFLSDDAGFITGQTLFVDGGASVG